MDIVVVESPAKAKTINQYLGENYQVLASIGHVRDLKEKGKGVIPEDNFFMDYELNKNTKGLLEITKAISKGDNLWLATDADREGEAIAWHIYTYLNEKNKLTDVETKRVVFYEITKDAILKAFNNPRSLDTNVIDSQKVRRALDYLMGHQLSQLLWKTLPRTFIHE